MVLIVSSVSLFTNYVTLVKVYPGMIMTANAEKKMYGVN